MNIREKKIDCGLKTCDVVMYRYDGFYVVKVDGEIVKRTANELFAVQCFNAI